MDYTGENLDVPCTNLAVPGFNLSLSKGSTSTDAATVAAYQPLNLATCTLARVAVHVYNIIPSTRTRSDTYILSQLSDTHFK